MPLAKIAARCMVGQSAGAAGRHERGHAAVLLGEGSGVPVHQVPGRRHHPRPGDEVHRRGDGRGRRPSARRSSRRSSPPGVRLPDGGTVFLSACATPTRRGRSRSRARCRAGLRAGRHRGHRAALAAGGHRGAAGEQGPGRPAAHRRHDQERRDRPRSSTPSRARPPLDPRFALDPHARRCTAASRTTRPSRARAPPALGACDHLTRSRCSACTDTARRCTRACA